MSKVTLSFRSILGALAAAGLFAAGSAHAQTLPDGNWTASGSLMVQTSTQVGTTCDTYAEGTATASTGTGTVDDLQFSGGFICNFLVSVQDLPYSVNAISGGDQLQFSGVNVTTSVGDCEGTIVGDWTPTSANSGDLDYDNADLGQCIVNGSLGVSW